MGDAKQGAVTGSEAAARRVTVAGDVTLDWNLARTRKLADSGIAWNAADRTEMYGQPGRGRAYGRPDDRGGGDARCRRARRRGLRSGQSRRSRSSRAIPASTTPTRSGPRFPKKKGDRDKPIWRVEEFLGLDRAPTPEGAARRGRVTARAARPAPAKEATDADLVILDDADLGFRTDARALAGGPRLADDAPAGACATALGPAQDGMPGRLGRALAEVAAIHAARLIVVMTLNDLRLSEVKISRELSWERIAGDLARELVRHPAVNGLVRCAHVVVSLGTGGAVLLSRRTSPVTPRPAWTRPTAMSSSTPSRSRTAGPNSTPGAMIGYTSCLVARDCP